jgi:hypothetical protein
VPLYFPEPNVEGASWADGGENAHDWLLRSTLPRGAAIREFLNRSLSQFPPEAAASLAKRLRNDWQAHWFEIVVGRYLQVLGARVDYQPRGTNGTEIDFRATFPDGGVSIECVSKRFNKEMHASVATNERLTNMIDKIGPIGWLLDIGHLPPVTPDEFQPALPELAAWFKQLPAPVKDGPRLTYRAEVGTSWLLFDAVPWPLATAPLHIGPAVGGIVDDIKVLRDALIDSHKRRQARGAQPPVLLAVDCPFFGPDAHDFDQALFGQSVQHLGLHRETVGFSFNSNGLLVSDADIPFAGVMAFLDMGMTSAGDPLLYLNPHQEWSYPSAIAGHEQRTWTPSGVAVRPATREPIIDGIGFVDSQRWNAHDDGDAS